MCSCGVEESQLNDAVMTWHQLNDLQQNLEQLIAHDQHQMDYLDVATDVVSLSASDVDATVDDLQVNIIL